MEILVTNPTDKTITPTINFLSVEMVEHHHNWMVYSTALCPPTIMVYCKDCGEEGSVSDFSEDEWDNAFWAPEEEYPWPDKDRVSVNKHKEKGE